MNGIEHEDALRVGTVIRAARKLRGLSQSAVARELEISQVTLSSIENGRVAISSSLWYRFSRVLKLLPDHTFSEGIVDSCSVNGLSDPSETGFNIPKRYTNNAFSTVRGTQPLFRFLEYYCGRKALEEFLKEHLKIDPDIRFIFSLRLSVRFNCDLAAYLIQSGHLKASNLDAVTNSLINPKTHGMLAHYYEGVQDPLNLIKTLIRHVSLYEQNFSYSIINETKRGIDVASTPADFMRYFSYKEEELPDFINQYRLSFIKSFSRYQGQKQPVKVQLIPGATKRKTECIFRITM